MAALLLLLLFGNVAMYMSQIELDDRFLEFRKQGMWLVEFYAPWCGYCKKLEPIYKEVEIELKQVKSPVFVAKLDCTKYSHIATEFSIKGFPTILFIHGDRVFTHTGDRSKENIVEFALRAQGPTVRNLDNADNFNEALKQHDDSVFFLYIGDISNERDSLFKMYSLAADVYAVHSYFYFGNKDISEKINVKRDPTVFAIKDTRFYEYLPTNGSATQSSLQLFINRERFATFPKMSGGSLNDLVNVVKFLVILALEPQQLDDPSTISARLFHVVKEVAFNKRDQFHDQFQFLWMDNTETVNNIAMTFLATPVLMIMEVEEHMYYLAPSAANLTVTNLIEYLTSVAEGKEQAHGGTGFLMRLKGVLFDLVSTILNIWKSSRWLFFLIIGFPTMIISIIGYSLCCIEVTDNISDYDDEEDDEEMYSLDDASLPPIIPWHGELPPYGDVDDISLNDKERDKKNE